jgi:hypothetical protein
MAESEPRLMTIGSLCLMMVSVKRKDGHSANEEVKMEKVLKK